MIAIALYFLIFNCCLQNVLQQELNSHRKENVLQNIDDEPLASSVPSYKHDNPSLKKDNIVDENQAKNIPDEQQMKRDGPSQLKLLGSFRSFKNGLEDGVNAANTLFGDMQKAGRGIFGMLSDGAQSFLPFN